MKAYPLPVRLADLLQSNKVESDRLEFKEGWNPAAVLRTVCAFANDFHNYGGGYIILGLAERDGKAVLPPAGIADNQIDRIQKELLKYGNLIQPPYFPLDGGPLHRHSQNPRCHAPQRLPATDLRYR